MSNQYSEQSKINRQFAIKNGNKTYEGTNCKRCGNTIKRTINSECIKCSRERGLQKLYNDSLMEKYRSPEKTKIRLRNWRAKNPEKVRAQYYRSDPIKRNERGAFRRAKKRQQTPINVDRKQLLKIYKKAKMLTEKTGIPHEVDHIIPISKGGLHEPKNLQILTRFENRSKGNK